MPCVTLRTGPFDSVYVGTLVPVPSDRYERHHLSDILTVSNATTLDSRNTVSQGGQSRTSNVANPDLPAGLRKIIEVDGERFSIVMPRTAYDTMNSCIEVPENGSTSHTDILNVAMLLFMNYLDAATSMSESSGGGGSPGSGWGRDKDDDDREWARRCAMQANTLCKPIKRGMRQ